MYRPLEISESHRSEKKQNEGSPYSVLYSLRIGAALYLIGFSCIYLTFTLKNKNLASDSFSSGIIDAYRNRIHEAFLLLGCVLKLLGVLCISIFQFTLSDSSGSFQLRAGSKSLHYAVYLDVISCIIDIVLAIQYIVLPTDSFIISFREGGAEFLFSILSRYLHLIALFFYGQAYLLMELDTLVNNHFKLRLIHLITYCGSATIEYFELQEKFTRGVSSIIQIITFVITLLWVCDFESAVNSVAKSFHQPEFSNDVENQFNKDSYINPTLNENIYNI